MPDQLDTGNRTLDAGRIVFNFGQSMIDCVVRRFPSVPREMRHNGCCSCGESYIEIADHRDRILLSVCHNGPRGRNTKPCDEFAPSHLKP